jgi:starch-binding outer membrane protein, SusD/RagB family
MKRVKIKLTVVAIAALMLSVSCSDDFIEKQLQGSVTEQNYYKTESDAYAALIAVYDLMRKQGGGFENMVAMQNAGSDDFYAGGGSPSDGAGIHGFDSYTLADSNIPRSFWSDYYQGIFRANVLLSKIDGIDMDANKKARFIAETKALRGYYYYQLITMFKNIPLITSPVLPTEVYNIEQAERADVWAQIEADLTAAEAESAVPDMVVLETEAGRLSKGSIKAILGKVYLEQHKNTEAAAEFAAVNGTPGSTSQYGYHLLSNYADLWNIYNKFNAESILEASHTQKSNAGWGNWGSSSDEGNSLNVMVGPRGYSASGSAPLYETGWSFNPVTPQLFAALQGDPRLTSTVADIAALVAAGQATYSPGDQDTGHFLKKFMPTHADLTDGGGDVVLNYRQNMYVIRLADTYLLEAEALGGTGARAQALVDAVRARVGLASIPVSPQTVLEERRRELAGEGHRFRDLVRTGNAAAVLGPLGFVPNKSEFFPVPLLELSNTKIVQDPAYTN